MQECDNNTVAREDEHRDDIINDKWHKTEQAVELVQCIWHDTKHTERAEAAKNVPNKHPVKWIKMMDRSWIVAKYQIAEPAEAKAKARQRLAMSRWFGLTDRVENLIAV